MKTVFTIEDCMKLRTYLLDNFREILETEETHKYFGHCNLFLTGGAVKDILNDKEPKDIDIVVLTYSTLDIIKDFVIDYCGSTEYRKNRFNGYSIHKGDMSIDIWQTNDMLKAIEYNMDGLFYDIDSNKIISFGFNKGIEEHKLEILNNNSSVIDTKRKEERIKKLQSYLE